jgi:hypothetical protein
LRCAIDGRYSIDAFSYVVEVAAAATRGLDRAVAIDHDSGLIASIKVDRDDLDD